MPQLETAAKSNAHDDRKLVKRVTSQSTAALTEEVHVEFRIMMARFR